MKKIALAAMALTLCGSFAISADKPQAPKIDEAGLIDDGSPGYETVKNNCVVCHSAKLVTQNRYSAESWLRSIRWMQKTQSLWSFCDNDGWSIEKINAQNTTKPVCETEKNMIAYLAKNYAPSENAGRRANLPANQMPPIPVSK
ncbi:MAG: hypothetical protein RL154_664 [Pseudomonadota bacterium]|jgi:hypothetical protein